MNSSTQAPHLVVALGASCREVAGHPYSRQARQEARSQAGRHPLGRRDRPCVPSNRLVAPGARRDRPCVPQGRLVGPWGRRALQACPWGVAAGPQTCPGVAAGCQSCLQRKGRRDAGRQQQAMQGAAVSALTCECMCELPDAVHGLPGLNRCQNTNRYYMCCSAPVMQLLRQHHHTKASNIAYNSAQASRTGTPAAQPATGRCVQGISREPLKGADVHWRLSIVYTLLLRC